MKFSNEEFEKCKSDTVYFAEKYLGYELLPRQKAYLKIHSSGQKFMFYGHRQGKEMVEKIISEYNSFKEEIK